MEANKVVDVSGFFISGITTLSLSVLIFEFIENPLLSFFPFSFIVVLYLSSMYLRNRFWKTAWKEDKSPLLRNSFLFIWIMGILTLAVFIYFGSLQIVTYPLKHYAFNPYLIAIAVLWSAYSILEFYMINKVSSLYEKIKYLSIANIVLVDISIIFLNYLYYLLPISLILLSISAFISAFRIANWKERLEESDKRRSFQKFS